MLNFNPDDIKKQNEDFEDEYLSEFATKSKNSLGRFDEEKECLLRNVFQRDRDRIIHSKAFRRLKHKTQVFVSPSGDHYRTRLTHTLEVSQIARTIARALRLNEDLTEAISLGHDLGHTPFGHTGEEVLNNLMPEGFKHNEQSIRVVTVIEPLNLTKETLDGIENHTGSRKPFTLEGQIVRISDRIAYINHDIDDAVRAGMIKTDDLPNAATSFFGITKSESVTKMIFDVVKNSYGQNVIKMSDECFEMMNILRSWLFENVYNAKKEEIKVKKIITELFEYYSDLVESNYICEDKNMLRRIVCDYLAGMTDRYAITKYKQFFLPVNSTKEEKDSFLDKLARQNKLTEK